MLGTARRVKVDKDDAQFMVEGKGDPSEIKSPR